MLCRGTGYIRGGAPGAQGRLSAHMKYVEYRAKGEGEGQERRTIFSQEKDQISRQAATATIMSHTSSKVSYHKMVLSPAEGEYVDDWRAWTRDVMRDLAERKGQELIWCATAHHNTEHDHVHVILAGAGVDRKTGEERPVTMFVEDYKYLDERGHMHSDFERDQELGKLVQELEPIELERSTWREERSQVHAGVEPEH